MEAILKLPVSHTLESLVRALGNKELHVRWGARDALIKLHSSTKVWSCFFQRPTHRLIRELIDVLQLNHPVRQQPQRPTAATFGRLLARQGHQMNRTKTQKDSVGSIRRGRPPRPAAARLRRACVGPILARPPIRATQPCALLAADDLAIADSLAEREQNGYEMRTNTGWV